MEHFFILNMGYFHNHLATVVCGIFAAVLSLLWVIMAPMFPVLGFVFLIVKEIMKKEYNVNVVMTSSR